MISHYAKTLEVVTTHKAAFENVLLGYRTAVSHGIVEHIKQDEAAPALLLELVESQNINKIYFDKVYISAEYMPETCLYICVEGDVHMALRTTEQTMTYDITEAEYGDMECASADVFSEMLTDNDLVEGSPTQEEGEAVYTYLVSIMEELKETASISTFYEYIVDKVEI